MPFVVPRSGAVTVLTPGEPTEFYTPPGHLEIPGLEAILEYGDASKVQQDHIPGAMLINDQSLLDRVRITNLDGLHDDPEGGENRQANADRHGEKAGRMLYRGRTLGLTGRVEAGNIGAMRSTWRRLRGQFGTAEQDLLVHHPFEVSAHRNEVLNPHAGYDNYAFEFTSSSSGTASDPIVVSDGTHPVFEVTVEDTTAVGQVQVLCNLWDVSIGSITRKAPTMRPWEGQDIWLHALVKVHSAPAVASSIELGPAAWSEIEVDGFGLETVAATSVASPAIGTWYQLSVRVPASSLSAITTYVSPFINLNFPSTAGDYVLRFDRLGMVFLDPDEPTPTSYVDATMPGFSWSGAPFRSASVGPTHAVNRILDPRFESYDPTFLTLDKWTIYTTGLTVTQDVIRSSRWSGDHVDASAYLMTIKDNSTASRQMGVSNAAAGDDAVVVAGRTYRWSVKVNLLRRPSTGAVRASILWIDQNGVQLSVSSSDVIPFGESVANVQATAPAGAVLGVAIVANLATTTPLTILEMFVSDPCFVDVTDWDPGDFYGVGDQAEEVDRHRRIPRPFLLKNVRANDMKAPEQQSRSRAWRDFTMSLRAADPRIYCMDVRRNGSRMPDVVSALYYVASGAIFETEFAPAPVPTDFVYEGQSIPADVAWTNESGLSPSLPLHPNGGVGLELWADLSYVTRPASPVRARFYQPSYLYTSPRVVLGGSPVSRFLPPGFMDESPGWAIFSPLAGTNTNLVFYNSIAILLKRVDATTWVELRWSAISHATALYLNPDATNAPYTFELWSSHNPAGSNAGGPNRLAFWDYTSTTAHPGNVLFDPLNQTEFLEAEMVGGTISWGLWESYPGPPGTRSTQGRIEVGTYDMSSALQAVIGTGVSGSAGIAMKVDNPSGNTSNYDISSGETGPSLPAWNLTAGNPPFAHYIELSDATWSPETVEIPVIGDAEDTPPVIELHGRLVNPIITFEIPQEDGTTHLVRVMLEGAIAARDTLTIDLSADGSIIDARGNNRYNMMSPGSRLPMLKPGLNKATLVSNDWSTGVPEHLSVVWRDALR